MFFAGLLALFAPSGTGAGVLTEDDPPKAVVSTTGNDSELLKAVPISKQAGKRERVAMSLGPDQLKRIGSGERLTVSSEVQVSTTCVSKGPRCVGSHYEINPSVTARIVLSPSASAAAPGFALSSTVKKLCKQRRPNRNHHCTLTIPNTTTTIGDLSTLPCPANACFVNLIVGAANKRAKPSNRIVLGADRPDGTVTQDKGRLNVIQARAEVPEPTTASSTELVNTTLPLTEGKKEKRRVVYSVPIVAPKKGEVIAFDSSYLTGISELRFNTFVSSRVSFGESPTATEPSGVARRVSILRGDATESNGFNCTLGPSGFANPCTTVKAGATRIARDGVDDAGLPATVYLNVVAAAKPLLAEKVHSGAQISLGEGSGLTVLRFTP